MFNVWINDGTTEMPTDDILYIVAKDGIFLKKKLGFFESIAKVDQMSILQDVDPYATMDIKPIPRKKFAQIISFYREVAKQFSGEAMTILHYNPKRKRFRIEIPDQEVSGGGVGWESLESYKGYVRIGSIHSHNHMSAFHSGTDDNDEFNWDGIHITIGKVGNPNVDISASLVFNGTRFMIDPCDYVEDLEMVESEASYVGPKTYKWEGNKLVPANDAAKKTVTLGYRIKNERAKERKFPSTWLKNVSKWMPRTQPNQGIYSGGVNGIVGPARQPWQHNPHGNPYWGRFHQGRHNGRQALLRRQFNTGNNHDQVAAQEGVSFDTAYEPGDPMDWDPCENCPYCNYKSNQLLMDLINQLDLDEDQLAQLGLTEEEDDNPLAGEYDGGEVYVGGP